MAWEASAQRKQDAKICYKKPRFPSSVSIHKEKRILGLILLQMNVTWVSSADWKASVQVRDITVYFLWKEIKMLFLMNLERTQL